MNPDKLSIYVSSCDKYSWLWKPFFHFFDKNWPDCPYKIYLGSEAEKYESDKVTTLLSGLGKTWSEVTYENISQIDSEFVMVILDDFFLEKRVNTALIQEALRYMSEQNCVVYKLHTKKYKHDLRSQDLLSLTRRLKPGEAYSTSLQVALWNREYLLSLLKMDESPWQFEQNSPSRTSETDCFLELTQPALAYPRAGSAVKGRMLRKYFRLTREAGIDIDQKYKMSLGEQFALDSWYIYEKLPFGSIIPRDFIHRLKEVYK